jgi:UDP-N-acetylglucosamine--N-acetylmuramyl-(pentapeptide) pyrophosphoryl-undecaprenol N-acetylglucosamine transferase
MTEVPGTDSVWCVVAGGGTAGHVLPGLAVCEALVSRGHDRATLHVIGSARGAETTLVPAAGIALTTLPGRGLNDRRINLANLLAAWGIVRGVVAGIGAVRRLRPSVVLALGGYAAVPGVVGAMIWRVPVVVSEQNARASLANRLAGRVARACAVPSPATDLPRAVVTGNPVRPAIVEASALASDPQRRTALRHSLGVAPDRSLILVQSGSLGARSVNRATIEMVERLAGRDDLHVHHVVGRRDWGTEHAPAPRLGDDAAIHYESVEYEEHTDDLMSAADLFIGRAGASTVAELAVIGLGSILVPLPIAPRDAQRANAHLLADVDGAIVVDDEALDGESLSALVVDLMADPERLTEMARAARSVGRPDAADAVAALCEEHARA